MRLTVPPSTNVEDHRIKSNKLDPSKLYKPDPRPEQRVNRDTKDSLGGGASVDDVIDDVVGGDNPRDRKANQIITRSQFAELQITGKIQYKSPSIEELNARGKAAVKQALEQYKKEPTPQEKNLIEYHMNTITTKDYDKGPRDDYSAIATGQFEHEGKWYNLPLQYKGAKIDYDKTIERAIEVGGSIDYWPSYESENQAIDGFYDRLEPAIRIKGRPRSPAPK